MRRLLAIAVAASTLSISPLASAYCRTSSCLEGMAHTASVCDPPTTDDCGTALAWSGPCAQFNVQAAGSVKLGISATELAGLLTTAFGTWETAVCVGGGSPVMRVTEGPTAECASPEYNQDAGNANVIMFHDTSWPYEGTANTLALTTVTYDIDTGQIYDADMELNSADTPFTTGNVDVNYDLLSILTHESGHFQGMAHSHDPAATMWPSYTPQTTSLRTLSTDDVAGICNAYPPMATLPSCDPTPRHGFSALCAAEQPASSSSSSGCVVAGPPAGDPRGERMAFGIGLAALALAFFRRRSRVLADPPPVGTLRPSRR